MTEKRESRRPWNEKLLKSSHCRRPWNQNGVVLFYFISVLYHLLLLFPLLCVCWEQYRKVSLYAVGAISLGSIWRQHNKCCRSWHHHHRHSRDVGWHLNPLLSPLIHSTIFIDFFSFSFHRSSSSILYTQHGFSLANFSISCINSRGFSVVVLLYTRRR